MMQACSADEIKQSCGFSVCPPKENILAFKKCAASTVYACACVCVCWCTERLANVQSMSCNKDNLALNGTYLGDGGAGYMKAL